MFVLSQKNSSHQETQLAFESIFTVLNLEYSNVGCSTVLQEDIWSKFLRNVGANLGQCHIPGDCNLNTLRTGSFKLFKHPFPGFLTILTL